MTSTGEEAVGLGRSIAAACALTAAGGSMDACVWLAHGHVFANAQTGNIVLMAVEAAAGAWMKALRHVPSLIAFCVGVLSSRVTGSRLKRRLRDSRSPRLLFECLALVALAFTTRRLSDAVVTGGVAFLAGFQISSYSQLRGWSFNTGMTTGNLWHALRAAVEASEDAAAGDAALKAGVPGLLVLSFGLGALAGGYATLHVGDHALLVTACLVAVSAALLRGTPDPGGPKIAAVEANSPSPVP
jgi:uncharacterized membrane protein YoaK (UPF0700 family)